MSMDVISQEVRRIKARYHENDPFRVCEPMGILMLSTPMGIGDKCCKGFFLSQSRYRSITINSDLSLAIQRIIASHELGHAVLHAKASGVKAFHDFVLFDSASTMEYEANIFAADFLMDDDEVLNLLNKDMSFFGAAAQLNVPAELLDFKFRILKRRGYQLTDPPITSNGDFLKNMETKADEICIC